MDLSLALSTVSTVILGSGQLGPPLAFRILTEDDQPILMENGEYILTEEA